jgi:hypothetical protein
MTTRARRTHNHSVRAKGALAAINVEKTTAEFAKLFDVYLSQIVP